MWILFSEKLVMYSWWRSFTHDAHVIQVGTLTNIIQRIRPPICLKVVTNITYRVQL